MSAVVLLGIVAVVFLIVAAQTFRIVHPYERGVIERLGRYSRTVEPGLRIVVPFIEQVKKVDFRERVVDVQPQEVITKDNVVVTVDAVVYYEATDPVRLLYNVENFFLASTKLAQTNLRNVVGEMQLDEALTSREHINTKLREILDLATDKWGVKIVRVEIQRVEPPRDVTDAMHRQMKAERERRASVLEAEGEKQSQILRAEGVRQKQILEAEGQAQALREVAEAERFRTEQIAEGEGRAVERVFGAIHTGNPTPDLIAIRALEALGHIANGNATKIFLPLEASGLMSSLGAIKELFADDGDGNGFVSRQAHPIASGGYTPTAPVGSGRAAPGNVPPPPPQP